MKNMAKSILGVDIGYDSLKLALVNGKNVRKTAVVPMPKNLIREGRVVSTETMGELIRRAMREHGIRCSQAALVFPNETVFIRGVTMPVMTVDQLNYNLPFEFNDYITSLITRLFPFRSRRRRRAPTARAAEAARAAASWSCWQWPRPSP